MLDQFYQALPAVRGWIELLLKKHAADGVPLNLLDFEGISRWFPSDLVERAKVAITPRVPFPPLADMGLPELGYLEQRALSGVTYMNTIFVNQKQPEESLLFHEMVHVMQWERLGMDRFLLAYGVCLLRYDYESSPFERMAYDLQEAFTTDRPPKNLQGFIESRTDAIWQRTTPLIPASSLSGC